MADEQLDEKNLNAEEAGAEDLGARVRCSRSSWPPPGSVPARCRRTAEHPPSRRAGCREGPQVRPEKFAGDLLPVIDSLERGLELSSADDETIKPMREGIELTLKMFHDTLKRYNLEAVDPHGEPFNAEHHQAMAMQESADVEPNSVLKVFQKGYLLNGRLLRPAMVVVSKAPAAPSRRLMKRLEILPGIPI